jgi:lysozyme
MKRKLKIFIIDKELLKMYEENKFTKNRKKRKKQKLLYILPIPVLVVVVLVVYWIVKENINTELKETGTTDNVTVTETARTPKPSDKPSTLKIYDNIDGYLQVEYLPELAHHDYDWNHIIEVDGFKYYEDTNHKRSALGIDVSKFQGAIDWKKVKESNIEFVIIRMGYRGYGESGKLVVDEKFIENIEGALGVGLDVGVYFFSQAISIEEAVEEAEFVYDSLKNYQITYPVIFDTEEIKNDDSRTDGLTVDELTKITMVFCDKIEELGYKSMIYANAKWLTTKLDLKLLENYDIWYADYQNAPLYPYEFKMWQYSEKGIIEGIEGAVDLNIFFR